MYECARCQTEDEGLPSWLQQNRGQRSKADKAAGSSWSKWLNDDSSEPRCPHHPETEVQLFCQCKAPLRKTAILRRRKPVGLGFAGPTGAGKTLFLVTAVQELSHCALGGHPLGRQGLGLTDERFGELVDQLYEQRAKPGPTDPYEFQDGEDEGASVPTNFCWQLFVDDPERSQPPLLLAVYDIAGETWRMDSRTPRVRFERYLRLLSSLVFLVDGAGIAADLELGTTDAWEGHRERATANGLPFCRKGLASESGELTSPWWFPRPICCGNTINGAIFTPVRTSTTRHASGALQSC